MHIFIDKSVIEVYSNWSECFSTVFHITLPNKNSRLKLIPFVSGGQGKYSIDVWELAEPLISNQFSLLTVNHKSLIKVPDTH
jgi:hypothetical protein